MKRVLENKKYFIIISLFVLAFLLLPNLVFAETTNLGKELGLFALGSVGSAVAFILGLIAYIFTAVAGLFIALVVVVLVQVAGYSGIIYVDIVEKGWVIVRDLCNMFFILILLMIAFGTMLRQESYAAKKLLPKVLIMAILINFSKMFFGLIIDFAQVIMMTFVVSFRDGGGWFINMFRVDSFLTINEGWGKNEKFAVDSWSTVIAIIMGCLAAIIALIVLVVMLAVLVIRIVMLWIYAILSPFVFLGWAFPPLQKYTNKIWEDFIKQVTIGPILAFFIWLALTSANKSTEIMSESAVGGMKAEGYGDFCVGVGKFFCEGELQKFIIVIGFLMGGLMIAQQAGGAAGKVAGVVSSKGFGLAKLAGKKAGSAAWTGARAGGRSVYTGLSGVDRLIGRGVESFTGGKIKTGQKGLVGASVAGAMAIPGALVKQHKDSKNKHLELDRKLRDAREDPNAIVEHEGMRYKLDSTDGKYREVDESDSIVSSGQVLKRGTKDATRMGDLKASFFDASEAAQSGARAASNKAEEETIDKQKQKYLDSGMSSGEMARLLNDKTTSNNQKMALALALAIKKGFKSNKDVETARKAVGHNSVLESKFNDEVYKNQAHLAHDVSNKPGRDKFKEAIDNGKVDSTKLSSDAYKDQNVMRALEEHHGKDFSSVISTAFKRGKKYEKTIEKGLIDLARSTKKEALVEPDLIKKKELEDKEEKLRRTHAKTTGNIKESFSDSSGGPIDVAALSKYMKAAKAADINKISSTMMKDLVDSMGVTSSDGQMLAENIDFSKIKQLHRQGDNPELVKHLIELVRVSGKSGDIAKIRADSELGSIDTSDVTYR